MSRHQEASPELAAAQRQVDELHTALETRHAIGVAQGLLMAKYGLTTEQAFAYLRRRSQGGNVKLRRVADRVVEQWHDLGCRLVEFDPQSEDGPSIA